MPPDLLRSVSLEDQLQAPVPVVKSSSSVFRRTGMYAAAVLAVMMARAPEADGQAPTLPQKPAPAVVAPGDVTAGAAEARERQELPWVKADLTAFIALLDHPRSGERNKAEAQVQKMIYEWLAIQNPLPKVALQKLADPAHSSAEQRARLRRLRSLAEDSRWTTGSRFPPMHGTVKEVLDQMESCIGTRLVVPQESTAALPAMEVLPGKNSLWSVLLELEKKGLFVSHSVGSQLMLTNKPEAGFRLISRSGPMGLMLPVQFKDHGSPCFSLMMEPGMGQELGVLRAESPFTMTAAVQALPAHRAGRYAQFSPQRLGSPQGMFRRTVTHNPELRGTSDGIAYNLSTTSFVGVGRSIQSLPIDPRKNAAGAIGTDHPVLLETQEDGTALLTMEPFHSVAWPPTPNETDCCLWRMGDQADILMFDTKGGKIPFQLPPPEYCQRKIKYKLTIPSNAVEMRINACGQGMQITNHFAVPPEVLRAKDTRYVP